VVEPILREISSDIEFVDLTRSLREAAATGVLTYLPDDTHWTADGQRVAGEALYQHVTATMVRPTPKTQVLGSELFTSRRGSVHRF
ncbi:MAG: hypothetical protein M3M98_07035, partial [Nitrospirota bacterium]|nr:hypothetical protein [Nitrospirota bacterium]